MRELSNQIAERHPDVGFDPATISRFERGMQELSNDRLDALLSVFGLTRAAFYSQLESGLTMEDVGADAGQVVRIPRVRAAHLDGAGNPVIEHEPRARWCPFVAAELHSRALVSSDLITVPTQDNSMSRTLSPESIVLVNTASNTPRENGLFLLVSRGGYRFRRLQSDFSGGWKMVAESDQYAADMLDLERTKIIGRAIWSGNFVS